MIVFRPSASRHGISEDRALFVVIGCIRPLYPHESDPNKASVVLFLGPDRNGVPLEVAGIEQESGDLVIIHAMRLRKRYATDYEEVIRWR